MTTRRPPTLQTIADAMGVSRTTVSNAYNRPDQLTAELRERILAVADEHGYAGPNPSARSLRTGKTGAVGVLFTGSLAYSLSEPTAVAFLRGMAAASEDADLGLLLLPARRDGSVDAAAIRSAVVDGFVIYSVPRDHPALKMVLDRRLPTVIVDEPDPGGEHAYIGIDDRTGARMAAQHLLDLGHRNITVVVGSIRNDRSSGWVDETRRRAANKEIITGRFAGYEDAMTEAGIDWDGMAIYEAGENTPDAARAAAAVILDRDPQPTAILATSDQLAIGVLIEAAALGIGVPDQLSVVGFDDIPRASASNPGLSTVRQPLFEKGRVAVRLLSNAAGSLRVEMPIEFVNRASTGPVPP
jgi:DNA-binding LacI/PurR family transcriptional regulator